MYIRIEHTCTLMVGCGGFVRLSRYVCRPLRAAMSRSVSVFHYPRIPRVYLGSEISYTFAYKFRKAEEMLYPLHIFTELKYFIFKLKYNTELIESVIRLSLQ